MHISRRTLIAGAASAPLAVATAPLATAAAQGVWVPDRTITMIVAFAPGGGTDVAARTLARAMEKDLGQSVVVVNRPGAGGEIGWSELARARPDGATIGFINTPNIVTIPIERRARFRLEDFSPIANIVDDPGGYWVLNDSPIRSLADLVREAREKPGQVAYGTTGVGSDDHLATLTFERQANVRLLHVPFAGSSQVRNAILGRSIHLAAMNMGEGLNDMRNGLLRPLGQMAAERWAPVREVPTFRELGFDLVQGSMRGVAAPAGMPLPVMNRIALSVEHALADDEFKRSAAQQDLPLRYLGPEAYMTALRSLRDEYTALWAQHPWRD
ncbi:tripartite tricarboxylate transporter substrate binding protein [Roseomonas hellenica]|uniref:Tripartite tricarboxylate transporter substrate binding protein n=1 Tax=Plastoroseomonas hellenica TaxID=2687306 RepID=A0ABS5F2N3_9PROT|nr:tripartite tricarboxylate transporter substrate binding protein [Plastoroseomonas hellenica]MBR0666793.1 tripartite tricarboxylate transporter substrate binding protein [Plastoroseomonas hellenica]